ncbi:MAG: IS630 family transposase [Acidimicrobiales bacterium]
MASHKKGARRRGAWIVFQDESGFSLLPPVRATWSPRGQTPVLQARFSWKRLSMAAAVAYAPDGFSTMLVFQMRPGAYNDQSIIEFLEDLRQHLDGAKATLIWDGLPSHRSRRMQAWIADQRRWLVVERLPGYAPDLNPVELLWGNLKGSELANLCPDTIDEAATHAEAGLQRIGDDADLCFAFLHHCGLSL